MLDNTCPLVALVTCVIFVTLELAAKNYHAAAQHWLVSHSEISRSLDAVSQTDETREAQVFYVGGNNFSQAQTG